LHCTISCLKFRHIPISIYSIPSISTRQSENKNKIQERQTTPWSKCLMREYTRYWAFISLAHIHILLESPHRSHKPLLVIAIEGCIRALAVRHFRHQCFDLRSRLWSCCFLPFRNFLPHRFPLQYYTTILTPINPLPPPRFRYLAPLPLLNPRKLIISLTHPQNPQQSTQPPFPTLLIHPPSLSTGDNHITGTVASWFTPQHWSQPLNSVGRGGSGYLCGADSGSGAGELGGNSIVSESWGGYGEVACAVIEGREEEGWGGM
jgi:hypothetical protein